MIRPVTILAFALAASPAFASYGDLDTQLQEVKTEAVFVAQPMQFQDKKLAQHEACPLSIDHIVSIPDNFIANDTVTLACLTE